MRLQMVWAITIVLARIILELTMGNPTKRDRTARIARVSLDFVFAGVTLMGLAIARPNPTFLSFFQLDEGEKILFRIVIVAVLIVIAAAGIRAHSGVTVLMRKRTQQRRDVMFVWCYMAIGNILGFFFLIAAAWLLLN